MGNIWEWSESAYRVAGSRVRIGGGFDSSGRSIDAPSSLASNNAADEGFSLGLRVAVIPEPATLSLFGLSALGLLFRRRKMNRCMLTGVASRRDPFELAAIKQAEKPAGYVNIIKPYVSSKERAKAHAEKKWVSY